MAAAAGNKYAEKWTRELTIETLAKLEAEAKSNKVYYIGDALANLGLYHEWYSYVAEKFAEDDQVFHTIKSIDQLFEAKLVNTAMKGDVNATMAIFTLKNKHQWKDKSEVESHTNLVINWPEEFTHE